MSFPIAPPIGQLSPQEGGFPTCYCCYQEMWRLILDLLQVCIQWFVAIMQRLFAIITGTIFKIRAKKLTVIEMYTGRSCDSCASFCCHFYFGGVVCLLASQTQLLAFCVCVLCFLHVHVAHGQLELLTQCLPSNEGVLGAYHTTNQGFIQGGGRGGTSPPLSKIPPPPFKSAQVL